MKILFVTSEVYPLIKTGGLGDVAYALPAALSAKGEDVRVIVPAYPQVLDLAYNLSAGHEHDRSTCFSIGDPFGVGEVHLCEAVLPETNVPVILVDCPALYSRPGGPYTQQNGTDWPDNDQRFALLAWAAAKCAMPKNALGWVPDVVHANDWQAGLTAAYLHYWSRHTECPKTIFTIHNIQFQGLFDRDILSKIGLPESSFALDGLEYYEQVSYLKAGIQYSDIVTTVSPTYAQEILTPEYGMGMEGLLQKRSKHLRGIINGIDHKAWSPENDPWLAHTYGRNNLAPKQRNKEYIQHELRLPVDQDALLFSMVTRLTEQKGVDLLIDILPQLVEANAQVAILGTGDEGMERELKSLSDQYENISVRIGYFEAFAHQIIAGSDVFLMPSRFEPCGLTQMYALRYGTLPLVRKSGGLADTVDDITQSDEGTGFVFEEVSSAALLKTAQRAMELYRDKKTWKKAQRRAMALDFGWESASNVYKVLYSELVGGYLD